MVGVGFAVTVQGLQLYAVALVAILSCVPTDKSAQSAADTVAVTVFPDLENAVIETDAAEPLAVGTAPVACTVDALTILTVLLPVPNSASVRDAFELSKALDVAESWALLI